LNLRPPGPQPGALPDCATPRDASILRSLSASAVRPLCEHMFVPDESRQTHRCGRCSQSKPLAEFAWHRKAKGQRDNYCRPCRAAYKQEHYAAHRERYIANASRRKRALIAERTAYLVEFSASGRASTAERPTRWCSSSTTPGTRASASLWASAATNGSRYSTRSSDAMWSAQTAIVAEQHFEGGLLVP
jgi:hypothetical protein